MPSLNNNDPPETSILEPARCTTSPSDCNLTAPPSASFSPIERGTCATKPAKSATRESGVLRISKTTLSRFKKASLLIGLSFKSVWVNSTSTKLRLKSTATFFKPAASTKVFLPK